MSNNRIILKNTIMLYIRMVVIMAISLYTSRLVLDILGVQDYGIYNIVGGVVISLSFVTNALVSSTQRFLSYELGLGESGNVSKVFCTSINVHILYVVIVTIIFETIGLYFVNYILDIPPERLESANYVYQFSVITFSANLIRVPYNALIISYERMNIYAILSVLEAALRLFVVIALVYFPDKLLAYGLFSLLVTLICNISYILYCRVALKTASTYHYVNDRTLFKKIVSFSGWNLVGGVSGIAVNEGPNFLINIYLGVVINASMGIAKQVSSAVYSFVANFQTAFNPQIVKLYAGNKIEELNDFIIKTSQISYYLMLVITIPIVVFSEEIFNLWLIDVPEYAISFSLLLVISQLISSLGSPMWMSVHAIGNIRNYQLVISAMNCLVLPFAWLFLYCGYSPNYILFVIVVLNIAVLIYRILYLNKQIEFPVKRYVYVILQCLFITICCTLVSILLKVFGCLYGINFICIGLSVMSCCFVVFFYGIPKGVRKNIVNYVKNKIK